MSDEQNTGGIHPAMTLLPIILGILGLAGVGYMLWQEMSANLGDDPSLWADALHIEMTPYGYIFIVVACLLVGLRDLSGMRRYHILSDGRISLRGLFRVRMLYEFTNAATPSAAGGSTLEMLYLHREGLPVSKSTSITILGLIFDELFFIISFPLLLLFLPIQEMFAFDGVFSVTLLTIFLVAYVGKIIWIGLLCYGVFINPTVIGRFIRAVFSLRILKRWKYRGFRTSCDIEQCSREYRQKPLRYWLHVVGDSLLIWTFRFLIVNMLILAFNPLTLIDNIMVFARQITTMVVMLVVPTPGGSGFIEVLFNEYLGEFISAPVSVLIITLLWRLLTYYYYLIIGAIILPKWVIKKK